MDYWKIFNEGKNDAVNDVLNDAINPYIENTESWQIWNRGWNSV